MFCNDCKHVKTINISTLQIPNIDRQDLCGLLINDSQRQPSLIRFWNSKLPTNNKVLNKNCPLIKKKNL